MRGFLIARMPPPFHSMNRFSSPKFPKVCNLGEAGRGLTGIFFQGRIDVPIEPCYHTDIYDIYYPNNIVYPKGMRWTLSFARNKLVCPLLFFT